MLPQITPFMFPFDAKCAVQFKSDEFSFFGDTTIAAHDAMRVDYAVLSGGCTIDHALKAAALGVVDDSIVFVGIYQACVLSFTAYFGAGESSGEVSATMQNPGSETRTVRASSVVFDIALADSPLVAGVSNTFKRESPY